MSHYDVIIVGSGIAALTVASELCEKMNILIITKGKKQNSNSSLAQGGIAAAVQEDDHWKLHYEDTLYAGNFHNIENAVQVLVENGANTIYELSKSGMEFDVNENGEFLLGREGAHQKDRIIHAGGDATGQRLIKHLLKKINEKVTVLEHHMAFDIEVEYNRAIGVWVKSKDNKTKFYTGTHIILATGGCGALYEVTSNSPLVTGDGLAMAYRAGCHLVDMEFTQFHPTMLYVNGVCRGLISEAVRGEGAILIDENGRRIMEGVHPLLELAPRDVVARAIQYERLQGHEIYLDITKIQHFSKRFPTITKLCQDNGIHLEKGKIPVAPGMHFLMGGIETDLLGRTSVEQLYVVGEAACTGVHGANRLASNSLLEGLVFGKRLANHLKHLPSQTYHKPRKISIKQNTINFSLPTKDEIQKVMTSHVGITRSDEGLRKSINWFEQYINNSTFFNINVNYFTINEMERLNMVTVGWIIARAASERKESRGGHYRIDFPHESELWRQKRIRISSMEFIGVK